MVTKECLAILDAISLPVLLMDGEGRVKVINAHARTLLKDETPDSVSAIIRTDVQSFLKTVRRNRHCAHLATRLVEPLTDYYPASSRVRHGDEWQDCYLIELFPRDLAVGGMSRLSETRRREASLQRNYVRARESARAALTQANQDPLTGIANRRAFDQWLQQLCRDARHQAFPFSLLLIDLDFFKRINDSHGHDAGDQVLCAVASLLTASLVRKGDQVARIGGEEFAVLLPNTDRRGAEDVAWRLVMAMRNANKCDHRDHQAPPWIPVTLSIGAASWLPGEPLTTSLLMREADQALYLAKEQGRDQAVTMKTDS
jgi:diguanylate cyclase (GGDEF)-like protein